MKIEVYELPLLTQSEAERELYAKNNCSETQPFRFPLFEEVAALNIKKQIWCADKTPKCNNRGCYLCSGNRSNLFHHFPEYNSGNTANSLVIIRE